MRKPLDTFDRPMRIALCALSAAAILCAAACEKESEPSDLGPRSPYGMIVGAGDCKLFETGSTDIDAPTNQDCFTWKYTADGTLELTHVNAGFNCCPGEITADITISDDAITIVEHELLGGCRCLCLYDVEYKIFKLPPGVYTIRFVEPYALGDPPLAVTVGLGSNPTGSFCVDRTHYPWYEPSGSPAEPTGRIVWTLDCDAKRTITPAVGEGAPPDMSCAEYRYESGGILRITHENAGFNCCAGEITAIITVEDGVITIVEREDRGDCDCICLWDVSYEIANVEPGAYVIRFVEPYRRADDEPLEFAANLAAGAAGVACAGRLRYPWSHERTQEEDWAFLDRLRGFILGYIGAAPCGGDGDCRYIAFGAKPCGGPWRYLVYSTLNADPVVLARIVDRYNAMNVVFNRRWGIASDCSIPPLPRPGCVLGSCADLHIGPR
ncbi:MAG: hypothetical protein C4574_01320 [Candidatus Latescibacterota bacterium]|jgi:hypothetical protein|nr:MAG: hypothetical protein C4574_01320 [Candidatus Latescibacterota bacterium]